MDLYMMYCAIRICQGHVDVASWLIEAGADVNKANEEGSTPLIMAITNVRQDSMQYKYYFMLDLYF